MEEHLAPAKRCPECGKGYPIEAIVCVPCEQVLEERNYLRWVVISAAAGTGLAFALVKAEVLVSFRVRDAMELSAAVLLVAYPTSKLVQKLREPGRRVWREMGSVYSSRFDRALILGALVFFLGLATRVNTGLTADPNLVDPGHAPARRALAAGVALAGLAAMIAMLVDQGRAFFDPRVRNTYVARERTRG